MWWNLRLGQNVLKDVQETTTRALLLFLALSFGCSMVMVTLFHSGQVDMRMVFVFILGILITQTLYQVVDRSLLLAQVGLLVGFAFFFTVILVILNVPESMFLFAMLPLLAALLIGWPAMVAALGFTTVLLYILTLGLGLVQSPENYLWYLLFGGFLLGGAGLAVIIPLASIVRWSIDQYETAMRNIEEARSQRLELTQIQNDLILANKELIRLSSQLKVMTKKAEEARRVKEDFVASVSHELRTPLNMIIGYTDLIIKSPRAYGKALPSRLLADIASIQRNSEHLIELINDVLDLSQIDVGRMALSRSWVSIQQVVKEAVTAVQPLFQSKLLYLKQDLPAEEILAYFDATRIRQVLLNLLSNAGRYTDQGGVTLTLTYDEHHVIVNIQDTGRGIAREDLARIFEPFQQLDALLHHQTGSSGLGLTISKRFIEMHDGKMWLESEIGKGTTFSFSIPIHGSADESSSPGSPVRWINPLYEYTRRERPFKAPVQRAEMRFLIVENENAIQKLFHRYLTDTEVSVFQDKESAAKDLIEFGAHALIINQSPDGSDQHSHLDEILLPVPVISCWIPGRNEAARRLGVKDYLIKPIQQDTLLARLDELGKADLNILLVDDDRDLLRLFARMISLSRPEYLVMRASSGEEALQTMRQRKPDIVLLDLLMPGIDGFEVLRQKSSDSTIAAIPIIVVSSNDPTGLPVISTEFHVRMPKGFTIREFLDCILAIQRVFNSVPPPAGQALKETLPAEPASGRVF